MLCASIFHYGQYTVGEAKQAMPTPGIPVRHVSAARHCVRGRRPDLRERLRAVPGVETLLPALEGLPPAYLVGGAARDLLRGEQALDLDVAVEGDGVLAAQEIARRAGRAPPPATSASARPRWPPSA